MKALYFLAMVIVFSACQSPVEGQPTSGSLQTSFTKQEVYISMRDGVKLFTAIYTPKDASASNSYPFLMERTPYGCDPYGKGAFPRRLGPNTELQNEKYIFVYQDVRGRYKSEGNFEEMTPAIDKKKGKQTDESSDTYDTVDWLVKNIKGNNGKVGIYGISYPGFYVSAALPNAHPAIKAVSPQAPVTDEFMGDDANHNGAFFLMDNFSFMNYFGGERSKDSTDYSAAFTTMNLDAYQYYLKLGSLKNTQSSSLYNNKVKIWNEYLQHDTYDAYWQDRNIRPHLKNIKPAVLVVGGMFDAEDMYGAQRTYEAIEKQSKENDNHILLGPWSHGAWARGEWTKFGQYTFGQNVNTKYQQMITNFFNYHLKEKGSDNTAEATIFFTGTNEWKTFDKWPTENVKKQVLHLGANNSLTDFFNDAVTTESYVSDPANPVPYINATAGNRRSDYLVEDQKFASKRPDVLSYTTAPLTENTTIAGRIEANLRVSLEAINGDKKQLLDADFVVKIIDMLPDSSEALDVKTNGSQRLVRAEVFRGKFRNSFEKPEGFKPGEADDITFELNDASHTFLKGHRIMVQIQSSWFPIVDRNPQKFMRIPDATDADFQPVKVTVYNSISTITLPILQD